MYVRHVYIQIYLNNTFCLVCDVQFNIFFRSSLKLTSNFLTPYVVNIFPFVFIYLKIIIVYLFLISIQSYIYFQKIESQERVCIYIRLKHFSYTTVTYFNFYTIFNFDWKLFPFYCLNVHLHLQIIQVKGKAQAKYI